MGNMWGWLVGDVFIVKVYFVVGYCGQVYDGVQCGVFVGVVMFQQYGEFVGGDFQIYVVENVVLINVGVYVGQGKN